MADERTLSVPSILLAASVIAAIALRPTVVAQGAPPPGTAPAARAAARVPPSSPGQTAGLTCVAFSPDGGRLATGGLDGTAKVWDTSGTGKVAVLEGHAARVAGIAYSQDGKRIATASWDATARIWDSSSGQSLLTLRGHAGPVVATAFSPDGTHLATASSEGTAKVWDTASGQNLLTLSSGSGAIYGVAFSPDGKRLATAGWNRLAKVWDAKDGRELVTFSGHTERLHAVAFSPDGSRLATAGLDRILILWDASSGRKLYSFSGSGGALWALAFNPDGSRLATSSEDGTTKIWDLTSGKLALGLSGHAGAALGVAFSPDGKRLATAGEDGSARLWDARAGGELLAFGRPDTIDPTERALRRRSTLSKNSILGPEMETISGTPGLKPSYRIGARDVLQVLVWKEPEVSAPEVVVRSDGKISLPILKEVEVVGLTPAELERQLTEKLSRFINAPEVTVLAREINSEKVYLVGAVKREGPIAFRSSMTVLQALAEVGGVTDYAKKKSIYILRTENQKQIRLRFNYEDVIKGERPEQNVLVLPGDTIVVPQ